MPLVSSFSPDVQVPADIVLNSTLAAIAKHGGKESKLEDSNSNDHVYQITSSVVSPLIMRDLLDLAYQHFSVSPCFDSEGNPIQKYQHSGFHLYGRSVVVHEEH